MATQRAFGRRINPQSGNASPAAGIASASPAKAVEPADIPLASPLAPAVADESPSVEEELREWKRTRHVRIPWGQLSLIGSLCFGAGSFVLPDSVNSAAQWALGAFTLASLYAWWTGRRAKARAVAQT